MLPGRLAAERDRDDAFGLELLAGLDQFREGLRRLKACIGEDLGVVEHPVLAVNIDRDRIELAVAHGRIDDRLRHDLAPLAGFRLRVDVAHQIVADQLVELLAGVELHHGRGIAAHHPVDAGGARIDAAGDGIVDPGAAGLGELIGEDLHGGRFAGGGPPMENLGLLLREGCGTADEGNRKGIRGNACFHAHGFLPEAIYRSL